MPRVPVFMMVVLISCTLQAREIVLTFDDIPGVAIDGGCDARAMLRVNDRILSSLRRHRIPALGLVVEKRCGGAATKRAVEMWHAAGQELGNHTASHLDLNHTDVETFEKDVIAGEASLRAVTQKNPRYFRFPLLHSGSDATKKARVEKFLRERGYRNAVVTFDNQEWVFADRYAVADGETRKKIAAAYLDYMDVTYDYFERLSLRLFGREIPQVLLLHANSLNADLLDALIDRLNKRGYRFVSMDEALRDPAYSSPDSYAGPKGLSWLQRWAIAQGIEFETEPREPQWIADLPRRRAMRR